MPAVAVTEVEGLVAMGKLVAKMQVIHMYIYMSRERGRYIQIGARCGGHRGGGARRHGKARG